MTVQAEPAPVYLGLRRTFLETRRANLVGLDPAEPMFAAMVESVANGVVVSTAVTALGDASFYTSNGGGGIGGIKIPAIRELALVCLAAASELNEQAEPVDEIPAPPAADEFSVILMSEEGLRLLRFNLTDKIDPNGPIPRVAKTAGAVVQALLAANRRPLSPT